MSLSCSKVQFQWLPIIFRKRNKEPTMFFEAIQDLDQCYSNCSWPALPFPISSCSTSCLVLPPHTSHAHSCFRVSTLKSSFCRGLLQVLSSYLTFQIGLPWLYLKLHFSLLTSHPLIMIYFSLQLLYHLMYTVCLLHQNIRSVAVGTCSSWNFNFQNFTWHVACTKN